MEVCTKDRHSRLFITKNRRGEDKAGHRRTASIKDAATLPWRGDMAYFRAPRFITFHRYRVLAMQ